MADTKHLDDGKVLYDDADVKIIYDGQVIVLKGNAGPPPEPPADNSVPWMSFF